MIAVAAGLVVAGGATAIAATHLSRKVTVSIQAPAVPSAPGNGFQGRPGGGLGGPGFGGGGGRLGGGFRGGGLFGGLSVAATYLGVSQSTLQTELAGGKTLAQVATAHGKTADGLVSAMVAATRKQLDAAVSSGRFTKQQEDTIVASLEQRYKAMVNGTRPAPGDFGRGFGGDDGGGGLGGGNFGGGQGSSGGGTVPA